MTRIIGLVAAGLAIGLPLALAQGNVERDSVPADRWVQIGADVGFLVTRRQPDPADPRIQTLKGFFMARQGGQWMRLESEPLPQGVPVPLR